MPILFVLLGVTLFYFLIMQQVDHWQRKVCQIILLMLSYFLPLFDINGVVGIKISGLVALLLCCSLTCDWLKVLQWVLIISIAYLCIINYNYLHLSQFSNMTILVILLVFWMLYKDNHYQKSTILALSCIMVGVIDTYYMRRLAGYSVVADTVPCVIVFYMTLLDGKVKRRTYDKDTMQIKV